MEPETQIKKAVCVWCKGECGVLVHTQEGRLLKLTGDPDWPRKVYPPVDGCSRLKAAVEWFYHPDRLHFPLKRAGEKGENRWQQISWEQAFSEITEKLQEIKGRYGAEAIADSSGTGYRTEDVARYRFYHLLGSPTNFGQAQICMGPRSLVADTIVGMFPYFALRPQTRCIVLLGVEPLVSRPMLWYLILEAKKTGTKLIVIDPRFTRSAAQADVWLPVRPGTDCALLLGMINVVISEGLYDKNFVERWCYGFEPLKKRAAEYTLSKVEEITGVPYSKVQEAARLYARNTPGVFVEGMGVEHSPNNAETLHARWILAALAGNIDVEGGEELAGPNPQIVSWRELECAEELSPEQRKKQLGAERFRLYSWPGQEIVPEMVKKAWGRAGGAAGIHAMAHAPTVYRAMLTGKPYPVRALITVASNPLVTQANTRLVYRALKSLELYVVMDHWKTPSAMLADYLLPAASWLERPLLRTSADYGNNVISGEAALPTSIPGEYDHRSDYDFFRELGIRLGQGKFWRWKDLEEEYDYRLKSTGYTHSEFVHKVRCQLRTLRYKKYEETGFGTATGKVELYSATLDKLGYDPLPQYYPPKESPLADPRLAEEYPYRLITGGRVREYYHSEWRHVDSVRKRHPYPLVQLNPETASRQGIGEGDWVWIETKTGRVKGKAQLFKGIASDTIHAEHGWWLPELPGEEQWLHGVWEVNINVVMDDDPDVCNPILGSWPLKTALCKVYKVKEY